MDDETSEKAKPPKLTDPEKPDRWSTHKVVMSAALSVDILKGIENCQTSVSASLKNATTDQELISVIRLLRPLLRKDQEVFHWCFYKTMYSLDILLQRNDVSMAQKSEAFTENMLVLWALARGFKDEFQDGHYYDYVKTRYVSLLRESFGRRTEVWAPPLDERLRSLTPSPSP